MTERIAILASGEGTTAEALIHATQATHAELEVGLVISNNSQAGVFQRIERLNRQYGLHIATENISGKTHPDGQGAAGEQTLAESAAILEQVTDSNFGLVLLLGYMKKVRGPLLENGPTMLNTHPGPLPQTAGMHGLAIQEHVIASKLGYSVYTLHVVDRGYDTGHIVAEHRVPVLTDDTPESLFEAVQATEKSHLPFDVLEFVNHQIV